MDRAVVLSSGGINSTVAAAAAREQYKLILLHVAWGHRAAERERAAFEEIAAWLKPEKSAVTEIPSLSAFGNNVRVNRRQPIDADVPVTGASPATFVPGLLPSMLSVAAFCAAGLGAKRILVGTGENYHLHGPPLGQLYPDHRQEFIQTFNLMLHYAKPPGMDLLVEAPLIDFARADVIQLACRLKVPLERTWSCYEGEAQPCGRCLACLNRTAGFLQTGRPDPITAEFARN